MKELGDRAELEPAHALAASAGDGVAYASVEFRPEGAAEVDARGMWSSFSERKSLGSFSVKTTNCTQFRLAKRGRCM